MCKKSKKVMGSIIACIMLCSIITIAKPYSFIRPNEDPPFLVNASSAKLLCEDPPFLVDPSSAKLLCEDPPFLVDPSSAKLLCEDPPFLVDPMSSKANL